MSDLDPDQIAAIRAMADRGVSISFIRSVFEVSPRELREILRSGPSAKSQQRAAVKANDPGLFGHDHDSSCPKFAEHDQFCAAVQRAAPGGMPVLVLDGPARGAWITSDRRPWRAKAIPSRATFGALGFAGGRS